MASDVDICNLALSHLGDTATVSSISPSDGSAQADHCSRFYSIARDSLLEKHAWGFATKRVQLSLIGSNWSEWEYAYAQPSDALNIMAVLPPYSTDDYSDGGLYIPQPFSCEVNESNQEVIYTDQADAVLRYTSLVTDTTKFSPLFIVALSWHLASMLAGPLLKGDAGAAEGKRCAQMAQAFLDQAMESDASQRKSQPVHNVSWITGR